MRKYEYEDAPVSRVRTDKSKDRRVERALRVRSIEELTEIEDEGLDPNDVVDDIWLDETWGDSIDWKKK
jgi:hypothetical protein